MTAPSAREAALPGRATTLPSRSSRSIRVMPIAVPIMLKSVNTAVATTPQTIAPGQSIASAPSATSPITTIAAGTAMLTIRPSGPRNPECDTGPCADVSAVLSIVL